MLERQEIMLLIYIILVLAIILAFVIIFFYVYHKKKNKFLVEKIEQENRFEREISNAKIEIQEQTLKNVAWELHDNIGQLLSVANMQLNIMSNTAEGENKEQIDEAKNLVATTVKEVRSLSKTLNTELIKRDGLLKMVEIEMERIDRLNFASTQMTVEGVETNINKSDEIIIFRIIQEFLSNSIKHASAKNISVSFNFSVNNILYIKLVDDGTGFDIEAKTESSGLVNMKSRAVFLKASYILNSEKDKGTQLDLTYKL